MDCIRACCCHSYPELEMEPLLPVKIQSKYPRAESSTVQHVAIEPRPLPIILGRKRPENFEHLVGEEILGQGNTISQRKVAIFCDPTYKATKQELLGLLNTWARCPTQDEEDRAEEDRAKEDRVKAFCKYKCLIWNASPYQDQEIDHKSHASATAQRAGVSLSNLIYFDLNLQNLSLKSLPEIPLSNYMITHIHVQNNQLQHLPKLPQTLLTLDCANNMLSGLPEFPESLRILNCRNNKLHALLPTLPRYLTDLDCSENNLGLLPELPSRLERLRCSDNILQHLPVLPASLCLLECCDNLLDSLPAFFDEISEHALVDISANLFSDIFLNTIKFDGIGKKAEVFPVSMTCSFCGTVLEQQSTKKNVDKRVQYLLQHIAKHNYSAPASVQTVSEVKITEL